MLVINTSQPQRLYTTPEIVDAEGQYTTQVNGGDQTQTVFFDKTNKYIYFLYARTDSPWLMCERYTYDTNGILSARTPITLSGFGTFTSSPTLAAFQGGHSGNFHLVCNFEGGSGSLVQYQVYPVSVSGTTMTLGSALSVPTIGSYNPNRAFAVGAVVYVFYRNTSSNIVDTGRKYSGSWSTLSGAALPTNVIAGIDDTGSSSSIVNVYGGSSNKQRFNTIGAGSSHDKFYHLFEGSTSRQLNLKFDAATDTWSASDYMFDQAFGEINGNIILHYKSPENTYILDTSLALIGKLHGQSFGGLSSMRMSSNIIDLENGVWIFRFNTSNMATFGYYSGTAKRIGKLSCPTIAGCGIIYRIDGGDWKNFIPTSTTDIFELNYYGETSLEFFVTKTTGTLYVEVTE